MRGPRFHAVLDWDDLRYLLALRRAASLGAAARALKVDPSTMGRRLAALEASLGVQLVVRTPEGAVLNDAGIRASEAATAIDTLVAELERDVGGRDRTPEGSVRVAVTDGFATVLYQGLARLRETHPGICVELSISSSSADLLRHEADLAVRLFRETQPDLVVRKVGELSWALYAAPAYLERKGAVTGTSLAGHDVVSFAGPAARSPGGRWLDANTAGATIVSRATSATGALQAAKAAMGIAALPCFMASIDTALERLAPDTIARGEIFLVMPPDHKDTARVRIVADAIAAIFDEKRALFAGEG